ncbi:MAG: hypothetical protein ACPGIC_05100, partial [Opitutales bacterium]
TAARERPSVVAPSSYAGRSPSSLLRAMPDAVAATRSVVALLSYGGHGSGADSPHDVFRNDFVAPPQKKTSPSVVAPSSYAGRSPSARVELRRTL